MELYTPAEIARAIDVSTGSVRNYSDTYSVFLSDQANNRPRRFTLDDLRLFAFVKHSTGTLGRTHEETLDSLPDALRGFEWSYEQVGDKSPQNVTSAHNSDTEETSTALVPASALRAAQTMLQDRQNRIEQLEQELAQARARVESAQYDIGRLEGENAQLSRPWWKRLLGLRD